MANYTSYSGEIVAQLVDYRSRGGDEASQHRPSTDSVRMDQHEAELHSSADKWLASEQYLFDEKLTGAIRSVADIRHKAIELQSKVDQLLSDSSLFVTIEADMAGERNAIIVGTEKRMRAQVDWRSFRQKNNITTEKANYPESRIFHLAIIVFLTFVETIINAFFYENTHGLFGGFMVALGVAFVNMVGALGLGYGFRYKNLAAIDSKIMGWVCVVIFILLSVYCNALFSAYRAEYQLLVDPTDLLQMRHGFTQAASEAKKVFFFDMHFAELTSFVLFAFGIVLSGFAFYKGYTFDDKYPGHGALDRAVNEVQQNEIEQQDLLRHKIKEYLHKRRAEIQAAIHEPAQLISLSARCIVDLHSVQSTLAIQAQSIQREYAMVLEAYRNANLSIRATDPPEYFKDIPNVASRVDSSAAYKCIDDLEKLQEELKVFRDRYQEQMNSKLQAMHGDTANILHHTLAAFLKETEAAAKDIIDRDIHVIHRKVLRKPNA
ncbi:MAG: hypothetical protein WCS87_11655 [Methylococcaceae bacterium]